MVRIYGLKNCDSCRKARKWLEAEGVAFDFVDYRAAPVTATELQAWADAAGGPDKLLNRRSATWRKLDDADKARAGGEDWLVVAMAHPTLVKRPVLEARGQVLVGFDEAAWHGAIGTS